MNNCSRRVCVSLLLALIVVVLPANSADKKRSRWNPFGGIAESIEDATEEFQSLNREISDSKREVSNAPGEITAEVSNATGEIKADVSNTTGEIGAEVSNTTGEIRGEVSNTTGEILETKEFIGDSLQMADMLKALALQPSSDGTRTMPCQGLSCDGQPKSGSARSDTNVLSLTGQSADQPTREIRDENAAKTIATTSSEQRND
jgi:hypothetical protein